MIIAEFSMTGALRLSAISLACLLISGCETPTNPDKKAPEPGVMEATRNGPEDAAPGTCWGKTVSPAVVEQVSESIQIVPAKFNSDGTIAKPPVFKTQDRHVIVIPRKNNWFETPCPDVLTVNFVSSLQRAMQARGGYSGAITGVFDNATRASVARLQRQSGLDSSVLSLETARLLGLVTIPRSNSE